MSGVGFATPPLRIRSSFRLRRATDDLFLARGLIQAPQLHIVGYVRRRQCEFDLAGFGATDRKINAPREITLSHICCSRRQHPRKGWERLPVVLGLLRPVPYEGRRQRRIVEQLAGIELRGDSAIFHRKDGRAHTLRLRVLRNAEKVREAIQRHPRTTALLN